MPRLISFKDDYNVKEYFPNAYCGYNNRWELHEDKEYPFIAYMHQDVDDKRLLKNIRCYIERYGKDDVFYSRLDCGYSYCWNTEKAEWDREWSQISNCWYKFYFGDERDLNTLLIKYDDIKLQKTEYHPDHDWHNKENTRKW
jgi:hypothetical protein